MTSDPKTRSNLHGRRFLREAFAKQQRVLRANLELAEFSVTHPGKRGDVAERHFITVLRQYLPNRYSVDSAIVLDSKGKTSDQLDIVIYDRQYTPTLLDQHEHKYVPAEAVYGVLEVKPTINRRHLGYAADKAASVRRLHRTSVPIPNASGKDYDPRPQIDFIAGLVAKKIDWMDGFGAAFDRSLRELAGPRRIDCCLAVDGHCFDTFDGPGKPLLGPRDNALVFFLFRLLKKLQSFATVPAIDWSAYAAELAKTSKRNGDA